MPPLTRALAAFALVLAAQASAAAAFDFDAVIAAIQQVESSGRPWVILDNSTAESIDSPSRDQAERAAQARLALGHNLDLGLYQINSIQLRRPDVSLATIFDPDIQLQLARTILGEFLDRARALYGESELAWERAIGAYNNGHVESENEPYVARVLRAMGRLPSTRSRPTSGPRDGAPSIGAAFNGGFDFTATPAPRGDFDASLSLLGAIGILLLAASLGGLGAPFVLRLLLSLGSVSFALARVAPAPARPAGAMLGGAR